MKNSGPIIRLLFYCSENRRWVNKGEINTYFISYLSPLTPGLLNSERPESYTANGNTLRNHANSRTALRPGREALKIFEVDLIMSSSATQLASEGGEVSVVIDGLMPVPKVASKESAATFPSILTVHDEMAKTIDKASLSLKKRQRVSNDADNDDDEDAHPEIFVQTKSRGLWHGRRGYNNTNCHYFIGVLHKPSGKMRLVQADTVYTLRPHLSQKSGTRLWDEIDAAEKKNNENDNTEKTYWEKRKDLLNTFGGKRSVQSLKRFEKNRITEEKVDDKATEHANIATKSMLEKDAAEGIHHHAVDTTEPEAPPHDIDAQNAQDAYPLHGLLSPHELAELSEAATLVVEGITEGSAENPGWHPLVWSVLQSIVALVTPGEDPNDQLQTRLQCAMHVHYLIMLATSPKRMTPTVRADLLQKMAVSENTLVQLLHRFTSSQTEFGQRDVRVRTPTNLENLIKYAIVMWMYTAGFQNCSRLDELADALGVSLKLFLWYAQSLGCKVRKQKEMSGPKAYCITLQIPLTFPKVQKRVSRTQRRMTS